MAPNRLLALLAAAPLFFVACSSSQAPTTAAAPTFPVTPLPTAAAAPSAPSPASAPRSAEIAPSASPASASASPSTPASAASGVTLAIDPANTQASFHAREVLAGNAAPSDAVGSTNSVSGQITLSPSGAILPDQSKITIDVTMLKSDRDQRDNFIKRSTLETSQFPTVTFVPQQAQGLPNPLPSTGDVSFQIIGDLTVHGVTKSTTWDTTATFAPNSVKGTSSTVLTLDQFGMQKPSVSVVLSIEDSIKLQIDFVTQRAGG